MTGAQDSAINDTRAPLRDPAYFARHVEAAAAIRTVEDLGWYDSDFLRRLEVAKRYLGKVRPDRLKAFCAGFDAVKPRPGFRETVIADVFDSATCDAIMAISRSADIEQVDMQARENTDFGRDVIWDLPYFLDLQELVRPRIEAIVGTPLVSSHNFLSRYGPSGKCDLHMDHPDAMYTFDYCIDQDAVWPIHVSLVVEWPTADFAQAFDAETVIADPDYDFAAHRLQPNQALLFNGSSQWHYSRPKVAGGFCHLLFFHYVPAGCEALVYAHLLAWHFGIPELQPLCDLFARPEVDGLA